MPEIARPAQTSVAKVIGNRIPQAAHLANILLAAASMNHTACAQKQQSFKERMRHQVVNAGGKRTATKPRNI